MLCEDEIQYWDSGLFMSSGTTVESRGSYIEFSLENRKVRNYKRKRNTIRLRGRKKSPQFISAFVHMCVSVWCFTSSSCSIGSGCGPPLMYPMRNSLTRLRSDAQESWDDPDKEVSTVLKNSCVLCWWICSVPSGPSVKTSGSRRGRSDKAPACQHSYDFQDVKQPRSES